MQAWDADLDTIAAAGNGSVLAATTASFTTADETKLDGVESGATADQSGADDCDIQRFAFQSSFTPQ